MSRKLQDKNLQLKKKELKSTHQKMTFQFAFKYGL